MIVLNPTRTYAWNPLPILQQLYGRRTGGLVVTPPAPNPACIAQGAILGKAMTGLSEGRGWCW